MVGTGGGRLDNRRLKWPQLPQAYKNGTYGIMRLGSSRTLTNGSPLIGGSSRDPGTDLGGLPVGPTG